MGLEAVLVDIDLRNEQVVSNAARNTTTSSVELGSLLKYRIEMSISGDSPIWTRFEFFQRKTRPARTRVSPLRRTSLIAAYTSDPAWVSGKDRSRPPNVVGEGTMRPLLILGPV